MSLFENRNGFQEMREFFQWQEEREKKIKDGSKKPESKWNFMSVYIMLMLTFPFPLMYGFFVIKLIEKYSTGLAAILK